MDSWKNHHVITRSNIILLIWLQTQVPKAQREYYNSIAVTILQRRPRKLSAFSTTRYFQLDVEDLALETCVAYAPCCVPAEKTHKRNYGHKPKFLVTHQQITRGIKLPRTAKLNSTNLFSTNNTRDGRSHMHNIIERALKVWNIGGHEAST